MTTFPWRSYARPVFMQIIIIALVLLTAGYVTHIKLRQRFIAQIKQQLQNTAALLLPEDFSHVGENYCHERIQDADLRLSIINNQGLVICDSQHEAATMDNHASRPEIEAAMERGAGISIRHSDTLHADLVYFAAKSRDGQFIVRIAQSLQHIDHSIALVENMLWLVLLMVIIVLSFFAMWTGRVLLIPLTQILHKAQSVLLHQDENNLAELAHQSSGEWSELEVSLDSIQRNLQDKATELEVRHQEQIAIMSAISDAILAVDRAESVLFFNSKFAVLFGKDILEKEKSLTEIFREPQILELFNAVLQRGQHMSVKALAMGQGFYSLSVSPLKDNEERIYGAVGVFHDVTALKLAEQIRIDFVANVSHELRTPLTAIKGYAETLAQDMQSHKEPLPQTWHDFLQVIVRNSARLMSLIGDLLDLSSIESSASIHKETIDTRELSERILEKIAPLISAKQHQVELTCQAEYVQADPMRIDQVLTNLLDNACKYTPPHGTIEISWQHDDNRTSVVLKVTDNGPGIPAEHHGRLFERFYRVDKGRSRELGGTGLGLAIVKHIMQQHGGTVGVNGAPLGGTTFYCTFPEV